MGRWTTLASSAVTYGPTAAYVAAAAKKRGAKQKLAEFAGLVDLVRRLQPRTVLEIGTMRGGSLWAWCQIAAPDATIVSVDLPGGPFGGGYGVEVATAIQQYPQPGQTLRLLRGDSHSPAMLERVERLLPSIEFAFIDGDHSYDGVRQDFDMYGPLVNGLVAFHDVLPHNADSGCQVARLWRELAPDYETWEFTDPGEVKWDGVWGGIGVLHR